jgi:hypothetical protein
MRIIDGKKQQTMKKLFLLMTLILSANVLISQCFTSIDTVKCGGYSFYKPDTVYICLGDSVDFSFLYGCDSVVFQENFNNNSLDSGWSSNCNPTFTNPCGPGIDGTPYCWIGPATSFPRQITTIGYNVSTSAQVCFDMKYAAQGDASPCEGPDESTEGVHFQYSTVGSNGPWTDIAYWDPNGGYDPVLIAWNHYCVDVPVTGLVWFRWYQDVTSGNDYDHWGIDNVKINSYQHDSSLVQTLLYLNGTIMAQNIENYSTVPQNSGSYVFQAFNQYSVASDKVFVNVYNPPISIQNLLGPYYLNSPPVTLIGTPAPGTFSGPGVTGNIFDPAAVGAGTYTITYHHYHINTNLAQDTIGELVFFDDFHSDLGWTGYGTQWSRGPATTSSGCSGSQDPSIDHSPSSDNNIIGNVIGGCYPNSLTQTYWLTSPVINCSNEDSCYVEFYSMLGIESPSFDHAYISVFDGTSWQQLWTNTSSMDETSWTFKSFCVPQASHNPNFQVRFGIGVTDGSVTYKGWNIDDFQLKSSRDTTYTISTQCELTAQQQVTVLNQMSVPITEENSSFPAYVTIMSIDGKIVLEKKVNDANEMNEFTSVLCNGMYLYVLKHPDSRQIYKTGKLIISR